MNTSKTLFWIWLVPLFIVVFGLVIPKLTADIYWLDEILTMETFGRDPRTPFQPLYRIRSNIEQVSRWPPAYYTFLPVWAELTGWNEFSTRYSSLLTGLLTIAVCYRLGREAGSARTGFFLVLLLGFSAFHLYYLHEARGYALYVFFTASSGWLYWRYIYRSSSDNLTHRLALFFALSGLIYTHYVAAATLAAVGLYHLFFAPRGARWWKMMAIFVLVGVAYLPWIATALNNIAAESGDSRGLTTGQVIEAMGYAFSNGMTALFALLFAYGLVFLRGRSVWFVVFWLAVMLILGLAGNVVADFLFHTRQIIGLIIPLLLLSALTLDHLSRRSVVIVGAVIVVWIGVGINNFLPDTWQNYLNNIPNHDPGMKHKTIYAMLDTINHCATPEDSIILYVNNRPDEFEWTFDAYLNYYFYNVPNRHAQIGEMRNLSEAVDVPLMETYEARVRAMTKDAPNAWFFQRTDAPRRDQIQEFEAVIREQYNFCAQIIDDDDVLGFVYTNDPDLSCVKGEYLIDLSSLQACNVNIIE